MENYDSYFKSCLSWLLLFEHNLKNQPNDTKLSEKNLTQMENEIPDQAE